MSRPCKSWKVGDSQMTVNADRNPQNHQRMETHKSRRTALLILVIGFTVILIALAIFIAIHMERSRQNERTTSVQKNLTIQVEEGKDKVKLPLTVNNAGWTQALIVCPYSQAKNLPATFRKAAAKINTQDEGAQWIIFSGSEGLTTQKVSRQTIDFCSATGKGWMEISPGQELPYTTYDEEQ